MRWFSCYNVSEVFIMVSISNLGHACFMIKSDDVSIVIDPYEDNSVPGLKMPRVEANYVFCSHNHSDHCAKDLVTIVKGDAKVDYDTIRVPHDHNNGEKRGLNNMHLFTIEGYRILHTGDIGCIPSEEVLQKMKDVDVMIAPINGFYTISAEELIKIMKLVQPRIVIPMHYYKKNEKSGYPDENQIETFKEKVGNYTEIEEKTIVLDEDIFKNPVIIFKNSFGR